MASDRCTTTRHPSQHPASRPISTTNSASRLAKNPYKNLIRLRTPCQPIHRYIQHSWIHVLITFLVLLISAELPFAPANGMDEKDLKLNHDYTMAIWFPSAIKRIRFVCVDLNAQRNWYTRSVHPPASSLKHQRQMKVEGPSQSILATRIVVGFGFGYTISFPSCRGHFARRKRRDS